MEKELVGFLVGVGASALIAFVIIVPLREKKRDLHTVCEYVMGGPLQNEGLEALNPKTLKEGVVAICDDELGLSSQPKEDPSR